MAHTVSDALDAAWKIHAAQIDWTGKVDTKASFAFGIESAALGLTVALSAQGRTYSALVGCFEHVAYWGGLAALLIGAACALLVVMPRLRSLDITTKEARNNYIYFGHLRHWGADDLVERLQGDTLLDVVARQCVTMAKIAWRKHRLVQASMVAGAAGIALLVCCGVVANI